MELLLRRVNAAVLAGRVAPPQVPSAPVITFEEPSDVLDIRKTAIDPRFSALINEDPLVLERYRALTVKLLNLAERRKLKTLLITSAEAARRQNHDSDGRSVVVGEASGATSAFD